MSGSFILSVSLLLFYLKYKKNLLHQQYQMKVAEVEHQKILLHAIITSQEDERKRIGMDLHDEVSPVLASLRLTIENFTDQDVNALPSAKFNTYCKGIIDTLVNNVRNVSHNLSPLLNGAYGFYDAVYDFCNGVNSTGKMVITVLLQDADTYIPLDNSISLAFYRVITELINNTIKHASAKHAWLSILQNEISYSIDYKDDGVGLPMGMKTEGKGMGFKNIESRLGMVGAEYVINGNNGFHIHITLPIQ
jgi:signal transduction histidine kinase